MIYGIIISIITIVAILLTVVVLLQSGQGEGLSGGIAATGMPGQMMGARRTADLLSKTTTGLGVAFFALCFLANFFIDRGEVRRSAIQEAGVSIPAQLPSSNLPQNANTSPTDTQESND